MIPIILMSQVDLPLLKNYLFLQRAEENTQIERLKSKEKVVLGLAKMKDRLHFDFFNMNENEFRKPRKEEWQEVLLLFSFLF